MGFKISGIDLTDAVINTELRVGVLEKIVTKIANEMQRGVLMTPVTQDDLDRFREETIKELQNKYPEADIKKKS